MFYERNLPEVDINFSSSSLEFSHKRSKGVTLKTGRLSSHYMKEMTRVKKSQTPKLKLKEKDPRNLVI